MANLNIRALAMEVLGYTLADLRDPTKRAEIEAKAAELREAAKSHGSSSALRQADIAAVLTTFAGFAQDPQQYGPTVAQIADTINADRDESDRVTRNRVAQHLAKMRSEEIIQSAPVMESTGKRGRPEVFYFLVDEEVFNKILNGEYIAKG